MPGPGAEQVVGVVLPKDSTSARSYHESMSLVQGHHEIDPKPLLSLLVTALLVASGLLATEREANGPQPDGPEAG